MPQPMGRGLPKFAEQPFIGVPSRLKMVKHLLKKCRQNFVDACRCQVFTPGLVTKTGNEGRLLRHEVKVGR